MKVALIRRHFSATGGAELYLQRLLPALAEQGHALHLFTESWTEAPPGVKVHALGASGSRAERPMRFAGAVESAVARERFDCVFSLERTRRQDVYRAGDGVHRSWIQRRREFAPVWKRPFIGLGAFHRNLEELESQTFNPDNTGHVIVNSEMVKREILEHFRFPAERIHLIRNGIDVVRFQGGKRAEARARFGVKDDEFLLLFVGSGWERKGLKHLFQALLLIERQKLLHGMVDGVREFRSHVAAILRGAGAAPPDTQELSRPLPWEKLKLLVVGKGRRPLNVPPGVIFAGPLREVEEAYAAADLFAFLPIYEPSANVVFEALAAGLAVVTSAQNGAAEVIEEGVNGTVVDDPTDTVAVVEAIGYWWARRFYVPPIHAAALSLDRNVSETLALLERVAREKTG